MKGKIRKKGRILALLLALMLALSDTYVYAGTNEPDGLYALSAVLMDADSGRVLFEKNGYERLPMASTTKIMTLIVALENSRSEDEVEITAYSEKMPKVKLGVRKGERYILGDLFYSLMLESHNDSAAAIAEHVGGTVAGFADMMNQKARDIGCYDTYFITPNGLDSSVTVEEKDEKGIRASVEKIHSTTAADLARIMRYCIMQSPMREEFLKITRTPSYSFSDVDGRRSFSCNNHNAFLNMMDGALSGKTGFTGNAGYCYVGALRRDDRTFVVALLGCGWPNNKTYKWSDTRKLMEYGLARYEYREIRIGEEPYVFSASEQILPIPVVNGAPKSGKLGDQAYVPLKLDSGGETAVRMLLKDDESFRAEYLPAENLTAPVTEGAPAGSVRFYLGEEIVSVYPVVAAESVEAVDFKWCASCIVRVFLIGTQTPGADDAIKSDNSDDFEWNG